ncbi:MAG: hypothetical protein JXA14_23610 [Anaerolineae bacterium]|nr:hypothetical protein [Anaerolineae bacterium]
MNPLAKLRLIAAGSRLAPAVLVLVIVMMAACGGTPETVTTPSTVTALAPTATALSLTPTVTAPVPMATTDPPLPNPTASEPAPTSGNPFTTILGPVTTPPGWTVEPCEGEGPFLCVSTGDTFPATVELLQYPLEQHEDAPQWLADAGLEPGQLLDPEDPEHAHAAREVLRALRADHMGVVKEDRGITYPEGRSFVLLEPEEVQVGRLPGLFYGFSGVEEDGEAYERWLTYAALDGQTFYILTAFYDPSDTPGSFASDEALLTFAPYLRDIAAGLRLP